MQEKDPSPLVPPWEGKAEGSRVTWTEGGQHTGLMTLLL